MTVTLKFDSLTDLQSSQTQLTALFLEVEFDSLTDLQSSQTGMQDRFGIS